MIIFAAYYTEIMSKTYIWKEQGWPYLSWDNKELSYILGKVRYRQGRLVGKTDLLGIDLKKNTMLDCLSKDIVKSAELDGRILDTHKVRVSLSNQLGLRDKNIQISDTDPVVDSIVHISVDALANYHKPVTEERILNWKHALKDNDPEVSGNTSYRTAPSMNEKDLSHYIQNSSLIPEEMQRLLKWINTNHPIDPVLKAGVAHIYFWLIRPFDKHNGYLARTITNIFLTRADDFPERFFSLYDYITNQKDTYFQALNTPLKRELDITEWLMWFLYCLETALTEAEESITRVLEKSKFWEKYRLIRLNDRQVKMINLLWEGMEGKLTSSIWAHINLCSPDTALRDIQDLIDKKILYKHGDGGRSTSYGLN